MKQHCDIKIQFWTIEAPMIFWVHVLGDQNLTHAIIAIKVCLPGE